MKISSVTQDVLELQTDCLVFSVFEGDHTLYGESFKKANEALDGYLVSSLENNDISTKKNELTLINTLGKLKSKNILFVGLGNRDELDAKSVTQFAGKVEKELKKARLTNCVFVIENLVSTQLTYYDVSHRLVEGFLLANYKFNPYKKHELKEEVAFTELNFLVSADNQNEVDGGISTGTAFAEGTNLTRDLVNTPANDMTPTELANRAVAVAKAHGMEVEVLEKAEMEEKGMGGILAVSQGTHQDAKLVVVKYQGKDTWEDVIGFIGKGMTFDSGGISIKPSQKMETMICDMAGAAAVIGALEVIGRTKPKVNILAVIPITENMPSGHAYRPGDILTTLSGKTVQVFSTDAEGRLILADAITYANQLGVSRIVDLATLTGNAVLALGSNVTAVMTSDDAWLAKVKEASETSGELIWELPTFPHYRKQIESKYADLNNTGGREAGAITAGLFLKEFAEDTPWVHLDIAGPAWTESETDLNRFGGTGVMVRTLAYLAEKCAVEN